MLKFSEVTHREFEAAFHLKGISKRTIGDKLGVHDSYINKIINGTRQVPSLEEKIVEELMPELGWIHEAYLKGSVA